MISKVISRPFYLRFVEVLVSWRHWTEEDCVVTAGTQDLGLEVIHVIALWGSNLVRILGSRGFGKRKEEGKSDAVKFDATDSEGVEAATKQTRRLGR